MVSSATTASRSLRSPFVSYRSTGRSPSTRADPRRVRRNRPRQVARRAGIIAAAVAVARRGNASGIADSCPTHRRVGTATDTRRSCSSMSCPAPASGAGAGRKGWTSRTLSTPTPGRGPVQFSGPTRVWRIQVPCPDGARPHRSRCVSGWRAGRPTVSAARPGEKSVRALRTTPVSRHGRSARREVGEARA